MNKTFTNLSKRSWTEKECRVVINAALLKLIDEAGGVITMNMEAVLEVCKNGQGVLAMSLSDDDKVLTLTRIKTEIA